MKVTSELDALKTMGLHPVRFVVIPKMHGSLLTMPFLTMLANIMGILGGMLIAYSFLDISPQVFVNRMTDSLYARDIYIGIFKSLVFASLIVLTGTFFGLRVKEGAEGVGKVTTTAVVTSIGLVMIADSIMGLLFY
jgi:phospholipid/cholesterol/gamma-HCH transport system permease protein